MQLTTRRSNVLKEGRKYHPKEKRATKQVRIGVKTHERVKERAKSDNKTISRFLDDQLEGI